MSANYLVSLAAALMGSGAAYFLVASDRDTVIVLASICASLTMAVWLL